MSRYVFAKLATGDSPIPGASCAVIDAAIAVANRLHKTTGEPIYVIDTEGHGLLARGVARDGQFRWLVPCDRCKGAGTFTARSKTAPFLSSTASCSKCFGQKLVLAQPAT